jgi:uroporphyrin-III C-methyltransferase/precorrin-2 dehydrogenase/sirohydrochlorin ferrochelatase
MRVFLASVPLEDRRVVVVGGCEAGVAKARLASKTCATVQWFAPDHRPDAADIPVGVAAPEPRSPTAEEFAGAALVFIGLEDETEAKALADAARAAGAKLVNVVDRPHLSDFQTPALIDRDEVVVGVATGGSAPILARDVRARVEAVLPPGLSVLARLSREIRDTVKAAVPEVQTRRRFWEKALRGRAADLAVAGKEAEARREMLRLLNSADEPQVGVVHIVGAGPGDPELLTLKALRVLQDADVIVYDRLVSEAVLDYARRDARRIYVGKAKGDHSVPQREIERIMIAEAKAGHRVVRLKGGDPFVFGRGGEEVESLEAAGVETHVVPGISAAMGCAASAGVPLTHRDHAQAVTFVTGQPKVDGPPVDWSSMAGENHTLAVYMGVGAARSIASNLIDAGRDPSTPVAIVENGTRPDERVVKGRLSDLYALIEAGLVDGPAMLFIGETAAFAKASIGDPLLQERVA